MTKLILLLLTLLFSLSGSAIGEYSDFGRWGIAANTGGRIASEGIYEFTAASGRTYVGQSGTIAERLVQHTASGKLPTGGVVNTTEVLGGKTAREIAEQLRINDLGGVRNLENISNPIGPARQHLLPP
jgi:uncharacterized protein YgbK (DUF1537 family)